MTLDAQDSIAAVRRFNRFYTRAIGVLDRRYLGSPYSVAENRVLYEIANADGIAPKALGEITGLDAGYLSRILRSFERRGIRRGYYTDNREDALIMWKDPVSV